MPNVAAFTTAVAVKDILKLDPITITAQTSTVDAIELMTSHRVGCLPVVDENQLVGIITAYDFLFIAGELIKQVFSESVEEETRLTQSKTNQP